MHIRWFFSIQPFSHTPNMGGCKKPTEQLHNNRSETKQKIWCKKWNDLKNMCFSPHRLRKCFCTSQNHTFCEKKRKFIHKLIITFAILLEWEIYPSIRYRNSHSLQNAKSKKCVFIFAKSIYIYFCCSMNTRTQNADACASCFLWLLAPSIRSQTMNKNLQDWQSYAWNAALPPRRMKFVYPQ